MKRIQLKHWKKRRALPPVLSWIRVRRNPERVDPGNDPKHPSSRSLRMVRKLHPLVVAAPERLVINCAIALVGLAALLVNDNSSVFATWPTWVLASFGMAMLFGGPAVLIGMFRRKTTLERLGYILVIPACILYAITAVVARAWAGVPVFLIFLGIAGAKLLRFVISTAERDATIELGQKLDRDQEDS